MMTDYSNPQMKTAGELLKETRESKGISLMTVHEATKIPLDVLKAIEEGYSVRTVSPFYFKGFIKMYAEYLGVDSSKVMERPIPVLDTKKSFEPKVKKVEDKVYKTAEDEFDFNKIISKDQQRMVVKGIGALIGLILLVRIAGCLFTKKEAAVTERPAPVPETVSPKAAAEKKLIVPVAAAPAPQPAAEASSGAQDRSDKIRLVIKVLKGGWLQVRVDGDVVVESTLSAGTVKRWEADKDIVISGRMIHNLEFELNGNMLGTLGRKDRNAHRVIITRKGLSVSE